MNLFTARIECPEDWGEIFQSAAAFTPLVRFILDSENLPVSEIENLIPGTNAVFRVGSHVIKIFAPPESGFFWESDFQTELFSIRHANKLGVPAPRFKADGFVEDKYHFAYIITEHIEGTEFSELFLSMTGKEKYDFGSELKEITGRLNIPCAPFNDIDVLNDVSRHKRWDKYPDNFKAERLVYINTHDFGGKVFVHGDLCGDNILLTPRGNIYIVDFADAVLAPICYEQALVAVELFDFCPEPLKGYFGGVSPEQLLEICFNGLLIHDFGDDIAMNHVGEPGGFETLNDLRDGIRRKLDRFAGFKLKI